MQDYFLQNDQLKIKVQSKGGELKSLQKDGVEYVWNGDPAFWGRSTPVLFPFVGSLKGKRYLYNGKEYPMGQHGFARDMEFDLKQQTDSEIRLELKANEESLAKYPFRFRLEIGYVLENSSVSVLWKVINEDTKPMYFSIGGHPAFLCPFSEEEGYAFVLRKGGKTVEEITSTIIGEGGLASDETEEYGLENGILPISDELFYKDALVLESYQADEVALQNPQGKEYIKVSFDMPLVGLWSPPHKKAPFVCIEPWCGRCDSKAFEGTLEQRQWGNVLQPGEIFETCHRITCL